MSQQMLKCDVWNWWVPRRNITSHSAECANGRPQDKSPEEHLLRQINDTKKTLVESFVLKPLWHQDRSRKGQTSIRVVARLETLEDARSCDVSHWSVDFYFKALRLGSEFAFLLESKWSYSQTGSSDPVQWCQPGEVKPRSWDWLENTSKRPHPSQSKVISLTTSWTHLHRYTCKRSFSGCFCFLSSH